MNAVDTPLSEEDVDPDPLRQFELWFADAQRAGAFQPEAAAVATATPDGAPSVRIVLVKQTGPDGFVFYTNYESRKGAELAANPRAALMFHWETLGRVVRLEGPIQRTTRAESAAYAHTRPRGPGSPSGTSVRHEGWRRARRPCGSRSSSRTRTRPDRSA